MKANYVADVLNAGGALDAKVGARPRAQSGYVITNARTSRKALGDYLVDDWLPSVEFEVEPTTFDAYRNNVNRHIVPVLGHLPVRDLTSDVLKHFYSDLLMGATSTSSKPLSKGTVCRIHAVLHRSLRLLVQAGALDKNPAEGARPRRRKLDHYEIRTWSPNELRAFISGTAKTRFGPLWHLMAMTGIRRGEALGLRWHDLRETQRLLAVRRALNQVRAQTYVTAPKSAQARVIQLDESCVKVLRRHRRLMQAERRTQKKSVNSEGYVFVTPLGTPYTPTSITKQFQSTIRELGLPRIRLHDLRHTHASHLIESGANPKVVQERLGHADVVITLNLYSHLFPTTQREAVSALARLYR